MDLLFLGTSCMQPTKQRNHSAILLQYGRENILFDCGEGTQRQMRFAGIKPARITRLCISHWHGDHVFGIPGLLSAMGADQFAERLLIYGPKGTKQYMKNLLTWFAAKGIIAHEVQEVSSGIFATHQDFRLEAQELKHSTPCIGFSFLEQDKRRILLPKVKKLGIPEGPLLGKLQKGEGIVFNGKKIAADEVTEVIPGKKVSYIADTVPCDGANALAKNADLLISEGTHLDDIKEKTEKYMHLTVKQAALIASENNAKKLIITHLSPRYKSPADIIQEARDYFDNALVAEDFMKVKV